MLIMCTWMICANHELLKTKLANRSKVSSRKPCNRGLNNPSCPIKVVIPFKKEIKVVINMLNKHKKGIYSKSRLGKMTKICLSLSVNGG